jgi:hypothetical protein
LGKKQKEKEIQNKNWWNAQSVSFGLHGVFSHECIETVLSEELNRLQQWLFLRGLFHFSLGVFVVMCFSRSFFWFVDLGLGTISFILFLFFQTNNFPSTHTHTHTTENLASIIVTEAEN